MTNLYVESGCDIVHEYYLHASGQGLNSLLVMASREGGMDIEEVAETNPDSIHRITSSGKSGFDRDSCVDLGSRLGLIGPALEKFTDMVSKLGSLFIESDCSMIEINPCGDF